MSNPDTLPAASPFSEPTPPNEKLLKSSRQAAGFGRRVILWPVVGAVALLVSMVSWREVTRFEQPSFSSGGRHRIGLALCFASLALAGSAAGYLVSEQRRSSQLMRMAERLSRAASNCRESESRFRVLIDSVPDAILTLDPDGNVTCMNPAATRMFSSKAGSSFGSNLSELVHADDRTGIERLINDVRSGKKPAPVEFRLASSIGGGVGRMELAVAAETQADRLVAIHVIGRDVSAKWKAEQANATLQNQLQRAQKTEALGRLAGNISHDFNNFLTTIMANCQMARMDLVYGHPAIQSLDQIHRASQRASGMVRQILMFTRNQNHVRRAIPLEPVLNDALNLLRSVLPPSILLKSVLDSTNTVVQANVEQIHQVLLNLGTNAAHAMRDKGGCLEVSVAPIRVDKALAARIAGLSEGHYARISVKDTGHGMDAATLSQVFEPYFTTKPEGEGTGLGLAIVDSIIRNHNGAISVESEPMKGTTFHIYLPVANACEPEPELESGPLKRGNGQHILLVDDDLAVSDIAKRILERLGYKSTVSTSPTEALLLFRAAPDEFHCVVSELSTPEINGIELAAECRQVKPRVKFILTSDHPSIFTEDSLRSMGVSEFILKPYSIQNLGDSLHRVLGGSSTTA